MPPDPTGHLDQQVGFMTGFSGKGGHVALFVCIAISMSVDILNVCNGAQLHVYHFNVIGQLCEFSGLKE